VFTGCCAEELRALEARPVDGTNACVNGNVPIKRIQIKFMALEGGVLESINSMILGVVVYYA
jgi:hypothetical protein